MPKRPQNSRELSGSTSNANPARPIAWALIALLRAYRLVITPGLPPVCRFAPSCSQFAIEAIREHGAVHGVWLAAGRIARCHPWNDGGYDPVPARRG